MEDPLGPENPGSNQGTQGFIRAGQSGDSFDQTELDYSEDEGRALADPRTLQQSGQPQVHSKEARKSRGQQYPQKTADVHEAPASQGQERGQDQGENTGRGMGDSLGLREPAGGRQEEIPADSRSPQQGSQPQTLRAERRTSQGRKVAQITADVRPRSTGLDKQGSQGKGENTSRGAERSNVPQILLNVPDSPTGGPAVSQGQGFPSNQVPIIIHLRINLHGTSVSKGSNNVPGQGDIQREDSGDLGPRSHGQGPDQRRGQARRNRRSQNQNK